MKKGGRLHRVQGLIKFTPRPTEDNLSATPQRSTGDSVDPTQCCVPHQDYPTNTVGRGYKFPSTPGSSHVQAKEILEVCVWFSNQETHGWSFGVRAH